MPQGICILDTEGRIVRINRSIEKIQGEKLSEIMGRSPAVLFQDPASFEKLLARASESDAGQVEKTDVNLMNSTGETYLADINLVRLVEEGRCGRLPSGDRRHNQEKSLLRQNHPVRKACGARYYGGRRFA